MAGPGTVRLGEAGKIEAPEAIPEPLSRPRSAPKPPTFRAVSAPFAYFDPPRADRQHAGTPWEHKGYLVVEVTGFEPVAPTLRT